MTAPADPDRVLPVPLPRAWRLMNRGPTVLVTAAHAGQRNVMAAAWAMFVDFDPPLLMVVVDSATHTRGMIEGSGRFGITLPPRRLAGLTNAVGNVSGREVDKFARWDIAVLPDPADRPPRLAGGIAWLDCRLVQDLGRDMLLGGVTAAWADSRVFRDGRWLDSDEDLRSIHHVAAGKFFVTGRMIDSTREPP
jgi:flavin reductase (DIM6/NTAB) family NADH-FMN oxidoreductase RutF